MTDKQAVTQELVAHYNRLLRAHGNSVDAVAWKDRDVQRRNFAAISQLYAHETGSFTVHEVGCGLGDYADFLRAHYPNARYSGSDIAEDMIERCHQYRPELAVDARDVTLRPPEPADFVVESGIFNLRMSNSHQQWWEFVQRMLAAMFSFARRGIAANFLTSHVDWTRELGYYQDPASVLTFAIQELSRFAEIRHAYYPWEFTLLVYRSPQPLPDGPAPVTWPPATRERQDDRRF